MPAIPAGGGKQLRKVAPRIQPWSRAARIRAGLLAIGTALLFSYLMAQQFRPQQAHLLPSSISSVTTLLSSFHLPSNAAASSGSRSGDSPSSWHGASVARIGGRDGEAWPEFDVAACQVRPATPGCEPVDFTLLAEGDLGSRLHQVCAARAIAAATNHTTRAIWVADPVGMPKTKFEDLFQPLSWVANSAAPAQLWRQRLGLFLHRQVAVRGCSKDSELQATYHFSLFASPAMVNFVGFEPKAGCQLEQQLRSCMGTALQPSAAVQALVDAEPDHGRLKTSIAVFVDRPPPPPVLGPCRGCPHGNGSSMELCLMRRMTAAYLKEPSIDFTVGAELAAEAMGIAGYFHPLRAPLILQVTKKRAAKCPLGPPRGLVGSGEVQGRGVARKLMGLEGEQESDGLTEERYEGLEKRRWRRRLMAEEDESGVEGHDNAAEVHQGHAEEREGADKEEGHDEASHTDRRGTDVSEGASGKGVRAEGAEDGAGKGGGNDEVEESPGDFRISAERRKDAAAAAAAAEKSEVTGEVVVPTDADMSEEDVAECVRLEAAELVALSLTRGLISGRETTPGPLLVASRGMVRTELFRMQKPVCEQVAEIRPITRQKFAMFVIVEEKLKMMYCAVPKVACTSWLMWLRAQLGYRDPRNPWLALHEYDSGLHNLAIHFTERQAVRLVTRPDFFRFTFVRNPYSRAASAYSNKLVKSDVPGKKTGPGSREYWNDAFFKWVKPMFDAVKDRDDLVSFSDFTKLLVALMERYRWQMDRHIALQLDICQLDRIRYDFVGRFENLAEDVKKVVDRYGGKHLDIFDFGKKAHFTNTDQRLARMYDKDSYERVKHVYAPDFYVALNNITHTAPRALQDLFENEV